MTVAVDVDAAHGGRITSLRDHDGHEWLWRRDAPRRAAARPGDAFIDAGGIEECFPTLSGTPDHGDVWCRPWRDEGDRLVVETSDARLSRTLRRDDSGLTVDYELAAHPGYRFVWAMHALLAPVPGLRVDVPGAGRVLSWPDGDTAEPREDAWPLVGAESAFDVLPASDDGTALFALIPGSAEATVTAAGRQLRLTIAADGLPVAMGVWRNRGGYPTGAPYRSWGIEPMIGWHPRRDCADRRVGMVGDGPLHWSVRLDLLQVAVARQE